MFFKKYWISISKFVISCIALGYIIYLSVGVFLNYLGPNPIEVLTHTTGDWGLYLLIATLAVTPLRRHFKWHSLSRFRRFLGLWSFAFIFLHFSIYIVFDHFFDLNTIVTDIIEHPYIAIGFVALVIMTPLAITSFKAIQRKMGRSWLRLHQAVYLVAILGIIHYWWLVKADILYPLVCGFVIAGLLLDRVYWLNVRRKKAK